MKQKLSNIIFTTLTLSTVAPFSSAQTDETGFFASADITLAHDDNIYRVTGDLAKSDSYINVKPNIGFIGGVGKHRMELTYKGDLSQFNQNDKADFTDHNIRGRIFLDHSLRFKTRFEASYLEEHEEPGVIQRVQLNLSEYNKYEQNFFGSGFTYGSESSIGQLSFDYGRYDRNYVNNNLDYLDFTNNQFTGRFTYRIAPKTRFYIESIIAEFDYPEGQNFELDNMYARYRAGVNWEFTNKLSGDLNIGYQDRDYEQDRLFDITGLAYSANVVWAINTFTEVELVANRESIDSSLEETGGFLRSTYGFELSHSLTDLLSTKVSTYYTNDELVFSSAREDERYTFDLAFTYDISRLTELAVNYSYQERDSTDVLANFKANIVGLAVKISLEN